MSKEIVLVTQRASFAQAAKLEYSTRLSGQEVSLHTVDSRTLDQFTFQGYSRPDCEQAYEYVQFIPYIVLLSKNNETGATEFVTYHRGQKGGEDRLHGKYSVGVGGHISINELVVPDGTANPYAIDDKHSLGTILLNETVKEILEETNIDILRYLSAEHLLDLVLSSKAFLLEEGSTSVNSYHVALPITIDITSFKDDLQTTEPGVVDQLSFKGLQELQALAQEGRLEAWSDIVLKNFT